MKASNIHLLFFCLIACISANAQSAQVFYDKGRDLAYYKHDVQAKETLYAISKTYGAAVADIMHINKLKTPALDLGQKLVIPFVNSSIQYSRIGGKKTDFMPVYYRVKRKETAYRVCRSYLEVNLTAIKELNDLRRNSLKEGQRLLVGYLLKYQNVPETHEIQYEEVIVERVEPQEIEPVQPPDQEVEILPTGPMDGQIYSIKYENGAAFWNKGEAGMRGYYVLHRYAERNTWIEVTNPMYNTSVRAKVIGNIPSTGYPADVLVVVSPSIAKDLGALDERFYVKVRYLRAESQLTKSK